MLHVAVATVCADIDYAASPAGCATSIRGDSKVTSITDIESSPFVKGLDRRRTNGRLRQFRRMGARISTSCRAIVSLI